MCPQLGPLYWLMFSVFFPDHLFLYLPSFYGSFLLNTLSWVSFWCTHPYILVPGHLKNHIGYFIFHWNLVLTIWSDHFSLDFDFDFFLFILQNLVAYSDYLDLIATADVFTNSVRLSMVYYHSGIWTNLWLLYFSNDIFKIMFIATTLPILFVQME